MMLARLTSGGVAIGESALCGSCLDDRAVDKAWFTADDATTSHVDCSANEALSCQSCGLVIT